MRAAKELLEVALNLHRRLEGLSLIEKSAVMATVNTLLTAEIQEARLADERARQQLGQPRDELYPQ